MRVEKKYKNKCSIIFIYLVNINKYNGLQLNFRITTSAYYKLSLYDILLDIDKIIYMDGDTLAFEDLTYLKIWYER